MSKLLFFPFHTEREGWQWLWLFSEKYFWEIFSEHDFHLDFYALTFMVLLIFFIFLEFDNSWSHPLSFNGKKAVWHFKTLAFEFDRKTEYHMGLEQHEGK